MTPDELFQLIAANAQATAENTRSIADLQANALMNTAAITELRVAQAHTTRDIADLRAVISDVREIQAEDSRRFNETFAFMQLQLVRMGQPYEQNADLHKRNIINMSQIS